MAADGQLSAYAGTDSAAIDVLVDNSRLLWLIGILFFGLGDLLTTSVGLVTGWAAETGPLAAWAITEYGLLTMLPLKLAAFAVAYLLWIGVPDPHRVGVPLALAGLGFVVTLQNILVLTIAASVLPL